MINKPVYRTTTSSVKRAIIDSGINGSTVSSIQNRFALQANVTDSRVKERAFRSDLIKIQIELLQANGEVIAYTPEDRETRYFATSK